MALKDAGRGVLQAVFGAPGRTFEDEIDLLSRLTRMSGRPASFSMAQSNENPDAWRGRDAAPGRGQRQGPADPRPGLSAADRRRAGLRPLDQPVQPLPQLPAAGQAAVRGAHRGAARSAGAGAAADGGAGRGAIPLARLGRRFDFMYPLGDPPNYEPKRRRTRSPPRRRARRHAPGRARLRPAARERRAAACCWRRWPTTATARSTRSMR